jgi:hypothetical protein
MNIFLVPARGNDKNLPAFGHFWAHLTSYWILHPESTFERGILQSLERGNLQNQIFDNPQSITQKFMRGFVGAFLRLQPVKAVLMGDMLRSSFLKAMANGVQE